MYIRRFLALFLSMRVLSSPLFLLDDTQPQLGASINLLDHSACPPLPGYGSLPSINVSQAGNVTIASQTTYVSATQTGLLLAIESSAGIVAPLSTGASVTSEPRCTKIRGQTLTDYKPSTYVFPPTLLSPGDNRFFAFGFVRSGGQVLQINISGRPPSSPDRPESYISLANEVFIEGDLKNIVYFRVKEPLWVKIRLGITPGSGAFSYQLDLFQIDVIV